MCLCLRNTTVRARRLFPSAWARIFFSSFLFLPSPLSSPPALLIPAARGFRWRIILVNGHPRMLRREYCTSRSPSGHHRVSVEILSLSSPLLSVYLFFSSRSWVQLVVKNYFCQLSFLDNVFNIIACVTYYHRYVCDTIHDLVWNHRTYISFFSLFSLKFYIFPYFSIFSVLLLQKVFFNNYKVV